MIRTLLTQHSHTMDFLRKQNTDICDMENGQWSLPDVDQWSGSEPLESPSSIPPQFHNSPQFYNSGPLDSFGSEPLQFDFTNNSSSLTHPQLHTSEPLQFSFTSYLNSPTLTPPPSEPLHFNSTSFLDWSNSPSSHSSNPIISSAVHRTSGLVDLPPEVFKLILGYLNLESAVILSLSCKRLRGAIGNEYVKDLSTDVVKKASLLHRLEKDLPRHISCFTCARLHDLEDELMYHKSGEIALVHSQKRPKPLECRFDNIIRKAWNYKERIDREFSVTHFHMATKRSLYNPDYVQFLNLLSRDGTAERNEDGWIKESQVDCRISSGSLIHREQRAYFSDTDKHSLFDTHMEPCPHMVLFYINRHIYTRKFSLSTINDDGESQRIPFHHNGPEITLDLLKCDRCSTQCQLTMKDLPGRGMAIFYTRWIDLGCSIFDIRWSRYFCEDTSKFGYETQPESLILASAFEDDGGFGNKIKSRYDQC